MDSKQLLSTNTSSNVMHACRGIRAEAPRILPHRINVTLATMT